MVHALAAVCKQPNGRVCVKDAGREDGGANSLHGRPSFHSRHLPVLVDEAAADDKSRVCL